MLFMSNIELPTDTSENHFEGRPNDKKIKPNWQLNFNEFHRVVVIFHFFLVVIVYTQQ